MIELPLRFKGAPGSPYTRKMIAYLRYRHIRYELLLGAHEGFGYSAHLPKPKVELLPTFYLANEQGKIEAVVDSTPLIRRFEKAFKGRSAIPGHPVLSFINYLIEDYADEWLTKAMFHYRWYYQQDIETAAKILPRWNGLQSSAEKLQQLGKAFSDRQISRLYVVGSNDITAPVIESSYHRFLKIMDELIERQPFVLGQRPSSADFGIYAQLTQLAKFDPTPSGICLKEAPRVYAWTDVVDDLSGQPAAEDGWLDVAMAKTTLAGLLTEVGRVYAPVLLSNADAIQKNQKSFQAEIDGKLWKQPVFPYQAKCLQWINQEYHQLDYKSRKDIDKIIANTGCESLIL